MTGQAAGPLFEVSPGLVVRTVASFACATGGMYYLGAGKKDKDLHKMLVGAALVLAAAFVFL